MSIPKKKRLMFIALGVASICLLSVLLGIYLKSIHFKTVTIECSQFSLNGKKENCGQIQKSIVDRSGYKLASYYYLGKYQGTKKVGNENLLIFKTTTKTGKVLNLDLLLDLPPKGNGKFTIEDRNKEFYSGPNTKYIEVDPSDLNNYLNRDQNIVVTLQTIEVTNQEQFDSILKSRKTTSNSYLTKCPITNKLADQLLTKGGIFSYVKYTLGIFNGCRLSAQAIIY